MSCFKFPLPSSLLKRLSLLMLGGFLFMGAMGGAKVKVSPQACYAPCNISVSVTPPSDHDDKIIDIRVIGVEYGTSKQEALQPYTYQYEFKSLPPDHFQVVTTISDRSGHISYQSHIPVDVYGDP